MPLELGNMPLAVFTTLAPAGMMAYAAMALVRMRLSDHGAQRLLDHLFGIPFILVLSGFIASTVHLGTPANALYVLTGVGRSPLSNEVVSLLVFLLLAGSYWMKAMLGELSRGLVRLWLAATVVSAGAALYFTSVSYSVETIPPWSAPHMSAVVVVAAVGLGCLLAGCVLLPAGLARGALVPFWCLYAVSVVAAVVLLALFGGELEGMATFTASAASQCQGYELRVAAYALLGVVALALGAMARRRFESGSRWWALGLSVGCAACALAGLFVVRLLFYQTYMTVGI